MLRSFCEDQQIVVCILFFLFFISKLLRLFVSIAKQHLLVATFFSGLVVFWFLVLFFFVDAVQTDHNSHLISQLILSSCLLLRHLLECSIDHHQNIRNPDLLLFVLFHQISYLLFQLLVVVIIWHSSSLQLLLNFSKTLLYLFASICFLSFTFLLLVFINRNEDSYCLAG